LLDGLEPLLALRIDETVAGAHARLKHLGALGLMEFRTAENVATFFRVRTDETARMVAWLDDRRTLADEFGVRTTVPRHHRDEPVNGSTGPGCCGARRSPRPPAQTQRR
jgi:hypothetical protein